MWPLIKSLLARFNNFILLKLAEQQYKLNGIDFHDRVQISKTTS